MRMLTPILLALAAAPALAQDLSKGALFTSSDTLSIEIRAPWRKFVRVDEEKRWPAELTVENPGGEPLNVVLTVERRGISRQRVCDFPPVRLRFDKDSVDDTLFDGEGSLKLVTHCDKGNRWTQYVVLEMLAYRLYNLVSDYSLRVRPLMVTYRDSEREDDPETHVGFVIEDIDEAADRHDMKELEPRTSHPDRQDPELSSLVALFQYMVGNLDWSSIRGPDQECCHNMKLIGREGGLEYPIPYDFDVTGLVDAHYAVPPEGLGVRSVTTRLYRGYCAHEAALPAARARYLSLQTQMMDLIAAEPRLDPGRREEARDYLEEFFEVLRDDGEFEENIASKCRG